MLKILCNLVKIYVNHYIVNLYLETYNVFIDDATMSNKIGASINAVLIVALCNYINIKFVFNPIEGLIEYINALQLFIPYHIVIWVMKKFTKF